MSVVMSICDCDLSYDKIPLAGSELIVCVFLNYCNLALQEMDLVKTWIIKQTVFPELSVLTNVAMIFKDCPRWILDFLLMILKNCYIACCDVNPFKGMINCLVETCGLWFNRPSVKGLLSSIAPPTLGVIDILCSYSLQTWFITQHLNL